MNIAIFNEVATGEVIQSLKDEGQKYAGLYVDMNDAKQRKYVKDNASHIKELKKKVDRKRIDVVKEFKIQVEKEAASITEDLNIANLPFESLIDEYAAERKLILDAEKADKDARELAAQIEVDHEFGLLMNDKFDSDKIAQEAERIVYEQKLKADAIAGAKQELINAENKAKADAEQAAENAKRAEAKRLADVEQARLDEQARHEAAVKAEQDAEAARLANKEHVRRFNNDALHAFMSECDFTYEQAKAAVTALAQHKILNASINY